MSTSSTAIDAYAVVGNPVSHSLSPIIQRAFANQTQQILSYEAIELPKSAFKTHIRQLIQRGMEGVNVTVPFKKEAWQICDIRSPRADDAGAVNTLIFSGDRGIIGDNTDGAGLTQDLIANQNVSVKSKKILILGAGGAVRGVLTPLLRLEPEAITIANRTLSRAKELAQDFQSTGKIQACHYDDLGLEQYDLIINATSAGLDNQVPPVPDQVLAVDTVCYDMMYRIDGPTAFVNRAISRGVSRAVDGLGMLVEQAAESFFIWRGVRVQTREIIRSLRQPPK